MNSGNNENTDKDTGEPLDENGEVVDEETARIMEDYDIDQETAEKVQELIEEGFDEDDAVEFADEL